VLIQFLDCQHHATLIYERAKTLLSAVRGSVDCVKHARNTHVSSFRHPAESAVSQLVYSYSVSMLKACHTDKQKIQNIAAAQSQHDHDSSTAAA